MKKYTFPRWDDLPDLDLYMDQVITYLTEQLKDTYYFNEKFVTSSMINNYVKTDIVEAPIKKHYTKHHVAYFMVVTIMKRAFSMQQISELIDIQSQMKTSSVPHAYDIFIARFEEALNSVFLDNETTSFKSKNKQQDLMDNVLQAVVYKIHAEYVLSK